MIVIWVSLGMKFWRRPGENAEDRPYETGDQAGSGSIYLGNLITSDQPVPDPAGDSYSAPGILVWHVGDRAQMKPKILPTRFD